MTESASPYQPPSPGPPPVPDASGIEPPAVKVFGIIHLVLAGYGILMGGIGLAMQFANPFIDSKNPAYEAQMEYQQEVLWVTVMSGAFSLILACLLIVAGLKLIRSKPAGVAWSNLYAWTSITTKVVSLVVAVIFVLPRANRMTDRMFESKPSKSGDSITTVVRVSSALGTVGGPVIMCLYPGLALFFLSRPKVRAWRARSRPGGA